MRKYLLALSALFVLFLFSSPADADELTITGGSLSVTGFVGGPAFSFTGQGLSVSNNGGAGTDSGNVSARRDCFVCPLGTSINLYSYHDSLGSGAAVVNGTFYERLYYEGDLVFQGLTTVGATDPATFTFTGTLRGCAANPFIYGCANPIFSTTLSGRGIALLEFTISQGGYSFRSVTYNFQSTAIPEPATLILLGTGLVGMAARCQRRRADPVR